MIIMNHLELAKFISYTQGKNKQMITMNSVHDHRASAYDFFLTYSNFKS